MGISYRVYIDANAPIKFTQGGVVLYELVATFTEVDNPTLFDACPLISIENPTAYSGMIASINGRSISGSWTADDVDGVSVIYIDCDTYNAYGTIAGGGMLNFNKFVNIETGFVLSPGINTVGSGLALTIDRRSYTV